MISIHCKVMGLAMVMAALGTGCAVDAAGADLDQAGLDEVEELDSTAAALEEGAEEEQGGYQAQAPTKDLFGPSKGMIGQAPVGQFGQEPTGQLGQEPIGAPGHRARNFGFGFPGSCFGGFGGGFGFPFNINNNNNINVISLLEELMNRHNDCPAPVVVVPHEHHCPHHGSSCSGLPGWGDRWP
ncbi:hypothetical protein ACMHYB_26305 [Sorangium sp. So ce1128]